jgi:hypothetical protein
VTGEGPQGSRGRGGIVAAVLAGFVVFGVVGSQITPALAGVFYDDGIYLALAKALREGEGYRLAYLPGSPPGVHYPFGYPAFLALLWSFGPEFPATVSFFKWVNAAVFAAACGLLTWHLSARGRLPPAGAVVAVVLPAVSVPVVALATVLFAEPLFLLLLVCACIAASASVAAEGRRGWALAAAAGLLAGLAVLTRSIGVAVIGGTLLALLMARKRGPALLSAAIAAALVAPWVAWTVAHGSSIDPLIATNYGTYGVYAGQAGIGWLSAGSLLELLQPLGAVSLPPFAAAAALAAAVSLPLLAWGLVCLARRLPALGLTLLVYMAITAVWPYEPSRFVWAVLPLAGAAFAMGLHDCHQRLTSRPALRLAVLAVAVVIGAGTALRAVTGHLRGAATATQLGISATMASVIDWAREATDPGDVIASEDEAMLWLYAGRKAVPNFLWKVTGRGGVSLGPDSLRAWLDRSGANWLVLTGPGSDAAADVDALLGRDPGYLRLVRMWPGRVMAFAVARGG